MPAGHDRWGWHQLERGWARRLVELADISPGDLVVDVGAGTGVITRELLAVGARVLAVELHPRRAAVLRSELSDQPVRVLQVDASTLRLPGAPFKVVANPPFAITTSLLRHLTDRRSHLDRAVVVLPHWTSRRWASGRGVGGTSSTHRFTITAGPRLPAGAFHPAPPGETSALLIGRAHAAERPDRSTSRSR